MPSKLLIMGSSKQQAKKPGVMPALLRFNSLRWQILRDLLPRVPKEVRPRILVLTPSYGFISLNQPIQPDENVWTGSTWRRDLPRINESYNRVLRPRIDPGTDIFISADAIHQLVMNTCGLQQDVVTRGASLYAPQTTHGEGIAKMVDWLTDGEKLNDI